MFLTQRQLLERLGISHPLHNRLRKAGVLPDHFPGTSKFFWPQVVAALEKAGKLDEGTLARHGLAPAEEPQPAA